MEVWDRLTWLLLGIFFMEQNVISSADSAVGEVFHGEYCQHEQFEAKCQQHQIIIIERAVYGRMRLGRCVKIDFGFIGCYSDVIETLDATCSGQGRCELAVTDPNFADSGTPCNGEFKNYLEVSYKCVEVSALATDSCMLHMPANSRLKTGVLPSILSRERPCGSEVIPWTIQVASGQRINVSMLDFGPPPAGRSHTVVPNVCYKYGSVQEAGTQTSLDICAGNDRLSHIYTSLGSHLDVVLNHNPSSQFILVYEAVGCPSFVETANTWVRATDINTLLVGCKSNENVWQLVCRDTRWTGFVGNCSHDADVADTPSKGRAQQSRILPPGLTIGVILGVAITISLCIVVVGLVCLRRSVRLRRNRRRCRKESILLKPNGPATPGSAVSERIYNPSCYLEPDDSLLESMSHRDPYYSCRSEYSSNWNHHRHPPLERSSCHYAPGYCARSLPSATAGLDLVQTETLFHKPDCSRSAELSGSRDSQSGSRDCVTNRDCGGSRVLLDTAQSDL